MGSSVPPYVEAVGVRSEDCMHQNNCSGIRTKANPKIHGAELERLKD